MKVPAQLLRDGDVVARADGRPGQIRWVRTGWSRVDHRMETGAFFVDGGARMWRHDDPVTVLERSDRLS